MNSTIPHRSPGRAHVLIVSDDAVQRDVIAGLLRHGGCHVSQAVDSEVAEGLHRVEQFDMVIVDWPDEGVGEPIFESLKAIGQNATLVALIDAKRDPASVQQWSAKAALRKPMTVSNLTRLLERFFPSESEPVSA